MVPTLNADDLEKETAASLVRRFEEQVKQVAALGIDPRQLINQSLITPACGAGTLSIDLAKKVLKITREISEEIRKRYS
jgi:hypothetical protein